MKASELKELGDEELRQKIDEMARELFNLKVQHSTGQLKNTARLSLLRKDIARTRTVLRSREDKK